MIPISAKDSLKWWFNAALPSDPDYRLDIRALKDAVSRGRSDSCSSEYEKKVLIIRRPRTATQTRVLGGDELLKEQLVGLGIPTVIYEPGQHSFRCQVRVFQDAKGVIGLRGAEFANLLWCEGSIPIIIIQQKAIHDSDPPQSRLGDLLDLKVAVITRTNQNVSIDVDVKVGEILPLLTQYKLDH
jgi:capsular polysaccharide biosynthesis protein